MSLCKVMIDMLYHQVCVLVLLEMFVLACFRAEPKEPEGIRLLTTDQHKALTMKDIPSSIIGMSKKEAESQSGNIPSNDVNFPMVPEDIHLISAYREGTWESDATPVLIKIPLQTNSSGPFHSGHVKKRDAPGSPPSQEPNARLATCLREQSHKSAQVFMDLPAHVQFHLSDDWLDEVTHLSTFSLPPSCVEALCHPSINVSFRVVTNTSSNSTCAFMTMYGQAVLLLEQCRAHLQVHPRLQKTVDREGNMLYQIADHYKLIIFQNQNCHYTRSLSKISALTILQVLEQSPPVCLQNLLCSPSTLLERFSRNPGHWVWIPAVQGPPTVNGLTNCFRHFQDSQTQASPVVYVNICTGRIQHDLVLFSNPNCYVNRLERLYVTAAVATDNIPPSSCLSLLCDQRFRLGHHQGDSFYIMVFGQDVSLMSMCRTQLSSHHRSNRTYAIEGFTFPLNPITSFFLPDLDCYAFTSSAFTPVFVSIATHNVTIPAPCLPLLCSSDAHITIITNKYYYGLLDSSNQTASCFDAMTPNPETNDVLRVLTVSPMLDILQIAPVCYRRSNDDVATFTMYALTLDSSVLFPLPCYSHLCYGVVGFIEKRKERESMYYIVGSKHEETGCYSSLLTSNHGTHVVINSENCSFALVHLPGRMMGTNMTNMFSVSDPNCQIHESIKYIDMFSSNFIVNVSDVQNIFFDCLAKKIRDTYEYVNSFHLLLRIYGKGVQRRIPDSCIHLACSSETLISFQWEMRADRLKYVYILFYSMTPQGTKGLTYCNEALNDPHISDDSTPMSRETLIPSNVDLSGSNTDLPNRLFIVFPPAQCSIVQNAIRASVISFHLTVLKYFSQVCVERLICNSNVDVVNVNKRSIVYITYRNAYEYNDKCFGYFDNAEDFYSPKYYDVKFMSKKPHSLTCFPRYDYFLFDFGIKPVGTISKTLVSDLILGKHDLGHLASCVKCIPQSSVASQRVMQKNVHLIVSYGTESEFCQQCYNSGTRVGNFSGLVSLLNEKNLTVCMMTRNAPPLGENLYDSFKASQWYLYFVVHHLESCANLDRGNFRTLVSSSEKMIYIYMIQNKEGLSCLEEIMKSNSISCFQSPVYTICREHEGNVATLYLPTCYSLSYDKSEILSNLIVNSTENSTTISKTIVDLCNSDTHVASYVIPSGYFYFETTGPTSNLSSVLAALQPRWILKPASFCMSLLQSSIYPCATASSSTKVEELVQSQIGVTTGHNKNFEFVVQCITFVQPGSTLLLYRLIYVNIIRSMKEDNICKDSYKTSGKKVLGIFRNDSFSTRDGNFYMKPTNVSSGGMDSIRTRSCLPLKNDMYLASATASVSQNNTACLQDICSGSFLLQTEPEGQFSFIGPLSNSLYRSSCFKALPHQIWARVNEASQTNRVTINKFWPGCFYDFIILSNSKSTKIDDWYYLSTVCKAREIAYFIGGLILTMITIVGNVVVIYTLFYHRTMSNPPCCLRINLAFADLLVGIFTESQALHNHLSLMTGELTLYQLDQLAIYSDFQENTERFPFGFNQIRFPRTGYEAFCGFVFSLASFVSLSFMSLMTLERFLMVAYQRHHGMVFGQCRLTQIVLGVWFGGIVFSVLLLQKEGGQEFVGYFDPLAKITTSLPSSNIRTASFITFYIVVVFFSLTFALVVVVSVLTFWNFLTSHLRLRKYTIFVRPEMNEVLNKKLRVVLTVFVGAYLLSCVPLAAGSAFNIFLVSPACHHLMWWIYLSSSAWNCYLYNFRLVKFRKDVHDAFLCITTHSNDAVIRGPPDIEIQMTTSV